MQMLAFAGPGRDTKIPFDNISVKDKIKGIHTLEAQGRVELQLHYFLTSEPLYFRRNVQRYSINTRLAGPHSRYGRFEQKTVLAITGHQITILRLSKRSLFAVSSELTQLA